jgi:hypothetical protein
MAPIRSRKARLLCLAVLGDLGLGIWGMSVLATNSYEKNQVSGVASATLFLDKALLGASMQVQFVVRITFGGQKYKKDPCSVLVSTTCSVSDMDVKIVRARRLYRYLQCFRHWLVVVCGSSQKRRRYLYMHGQLLFRMLSSAAKGACTAASRH